MNRVVRSGTNVCSTNVCECICIYISVCIHINTARYGRLFQRNRINIWDAGLCCPAIQPQRIMSVYVHDCVHCASKKVPCVHGDMPTCNSSQIPRACERVCCFFGRWPPVVGGQCKENLLRSKREYTSERRWVFARKRI